MNIGQVAGISGLKPTAIRFYENVGLVKPERLDNGYRNYSDADVHTLVFLQRARSLGFGMDDCRSLLSLYEDRDRASADVKSIALEHLDQVDRKLAELTSLRSVLEHLVRRCRGDNRPDCPILDDLAKPSGDQSSYQTKFTKSGSSRRGLLK